jgi:subtilase family serine protease
MGGCPSGMTGTCDTSERSSDVLFFQGKVSAEIGTSASSPNTAGLFALRVKRTGERQGNVNPLIYKAAQTQANGGPVAFHHSNITGSNGVYNVRAPFNPVIGNGTPYAGVVLGFPDLSKSGNPNTKSNP